MKHILIALITLSSLHFISCSSNELSPDMTEINNDRPSVQDPIEIDIDEDGTADYYIRFDQPYFGGPYEEIMTGFVGRFGSYRNNELLESKEGSTLFLRNLEEIKEVVAEPLFWNNQIGLGEIVSITTNTKGEWPANWEVNSATEHSSYLLGLKMISDVDFQLAWLELEINTSNGNVSIVDKGVF